MCDHVAALISLEHEADALGQLVPKEVSREVFCRVGSISQNEWYAAGNAGLKAQLKLTLFSGDYQGEAIVELDGVRYGVYRTYLAKHSQMELYLEQKAGV